MNPQTRSKIFIPATRTPPHGRMPSRKAEFRFRQLHELCALAIISLAHIQQSAVWSTTSTREGKGGLLVDTDRSSLYPYVV
ncbi:hypothetical protein [Roseiflexus sp.]|uniref:hypothetical protein n=1 Tax=Roseiflexus sp. TaxID=2562120 RepID=UPI0035B551C3